MNTTTPSGILTGPNLLSCIDELSLQDHDDLTHCTQIATRSADMASSRYVDSTTWLDEYINTLSFFGWSVFEDAIFTRTRYDVSKTVADFLIQTAKTMPDTRQGNAMIDTLDALRPNKLAVYTLDQESLLGNRFQVIPARYDSKGILQIAVFNLELVAYTKNSNFLFSNREGHGVKIIQQGAYLKLDKHVLQTKRTLIEKKRSELRMERFNLWKRYNA